MLSTWLKTLECLRSVRGYRKVSPSSFVASQGGQASDMFRLSWKHDETALALKDYHAAFLTSPLFQVELWLLSAVQRSAAWRTTTSPDHVEAVVQGQEKSVGPWTLHAVDGDSDAQFSPTSPPASATRIMQCRIHGR